MQRIVEIVSCFSVLALCGCFLSPTLGNGARLRRVCVCEFERVYFGVCLVTYGAAVVVVTPRFSQIVVIYCCGWRWATRGAIASSTGIYTNGLGCHGKQQQRVHEGDRDDHMHEQERDVKTRLASVLAAQMTRSVRCLNVSLLRLPMHNVRSAFNNVWNAQDRNYFRQCFARSNGKWGPHNSRINALNCGRYADDCCKLGMC